MNLLENVPPDLKELFIETAKVLKGHQRRIFMGVFEAKGPKTGEKKERKRVDRANGRQSHATNEAKEPKERQKQGRKRQTSPIRGKSAAKGASSEKNGVDQAASSPTFPGWRCVPQKRCADDDTVPSRPDGQSEHPAPNE